MNIFEKSRFAVFSHRQHPLKHDINDFFYANARLPSPAQGGLGNVLDYIISVLYPNYTTSVATPADLPVPATANDYVIVEDDGDGKSAGYVYTSIDGNEQWIKRYDMDWSAESIYAEAVNRTQYMYAHKYGVDDKDGSGNPMVGLYAGQMIYGGASTNTNLTLNANAFDITGYVQTDNDFRPTVDNQIDLGTLAQQFKTGYFGTSVLIGSLSLSFGSITDSSGLIDFGTTNLGTDGSVTAGQGVFSTTVEIGQFLGDALVLGAGSITDESGAISFGATNLLTTGTAGTGQLTVTVGSESVVVSPDSIISTSDVSFGASSLSTSGDIAATNGTLSTLNVGNLQLSVNSVQSTDANGDLSLVAQGSGRVNVQSPLLTLDQDVTGTVTVDGALRADNLQLDGNTLSATNVDGNVVIEASGAGHIAVSASIVPVTDNAVELGTNVRAFSDLYLKGGLVYNSSYIEMATLITLREVDVDAVIGASLFWDGAKWVASLPDTEIHHGGISGLTGDDHLQYAYLNGRATGQTLTGGVASGENLTLDSTSDATKGSIQVSSPLVPTNNASFAVTWSGTDLGSGSRQFRDLHMRGEGKGLRLENRLSSNLPSASGQNVGRVVYATDNNKIYVDTGSQFIVAGIGKYMNDTSWDGSQTSQDFNVSSVIQDARKAIWQLSDNGNDFERVFCKIQAISATHVRVSAAPSLPAGSYRLIGIE